MRTVSSVADQSSSMTPTLRVSSAHLLEELRKNSLLRPDDWSHLPPHAQRQLQEENAPAGLLGRLVKLQLLTDYQAARISAGQMSELLVGNYRIIDFLGAGGMGMVLKAEHRRLRRPVALKLLTLGTDQDPKALERFYTEIWALSQLQHPNIVTALDAGEIPDPEHFGSEIHYLVMEYVPGEDLEALVKKQGPLNVTQACEIIYQVAGALEEAHKQHLVHRDIKPPNIRVTHEGRAKLLDFGVTRVFRKRLTEPGAVVGSLAFLAPEQARDASTVDIRADIFALGGTLFWSLTGKRPFADQNNLLQVMTQRGEQPPPSLRALRPDVPQVLDQVLAKMMAPEVEDRYSTPMEVMRALLPFLKPDTLLALAVPNLKSGDMPAFQGDAAVPRPLHRVLVVDDEAVNRKLCRLILENDGAQCDEAANGAEALQVAYQGRFDLILLDIDMPVMSGTETLKRLREAPPCPHLKVIMVSGRCTQDEMAQMLLAGADDYLAKPFSSTQLQSRVKAALRLKEAQDRSDLLHHHLLSVNHDLEQNLYARDSDLVHARNALVLALAELVAYRDSETGAHLLRLQRFSRLLAETAAAAPSFASQVDTHFINMLECCAPLHDIGKAGLPDYVLLKPGKLTPDERLIMQTHTTIGGDILAKVARKHGFARTFLQMAMEIARYHHERFDGHGYPDRLVGDTIPLAARIVAIADVYDAMRSRRVYKPALPHADVVNMMLHESPGHFDPSLLRLFHQCGPHFEQMFKDLAD